jgi:hypothetical protein
MAGRARESLRVFVTLVLGIKGAKGKVCQHMNSPTPSCGSVSSEVARPLPHTRNVTTPSRRPSKLTFKDGALLQLPQNPFGSSSSVPAKEFEEYCGHYCQLERDYLSIARECGVVDPHGYEKGRRDPRGTLVFAETVCVFTNCFATDLPWSPPSSSPTTTTTYRYWTPLRELTIRQFGHKLLLVFRVGCVLVVTRAGGPPVGPLVAIVVLYSVRPSTTG